MDSAMRLCLLLLPALSLAAQTPAAKPDALGRDNPRSAVSGFLEACGARDYAKASQYLDLRTIPQKQRASRGIELARQLETVLNSDSQFSVFRLSRDPQGDLSDDSDPDRDHVATITANGKPVTLDLERLTLSSGTPPVWLFSSDTVLNVPILAQTVAPSPVARYLPAFLSTVLFLENPLWKWIALIAGTLLLIAVSRQFDRLLTAMIRLVGGWVHAANHVAWIEALLGPVRVMACLLVFRLGLEILGPSAISRMYIGRVAQAVFVWSVAWCLMRLVELSLNRVELRMDTARRFASRSVLHLGRRTLKTAIAILAVLLVLSNWGYDTTTLVAGLGVGGIAIALAAQQTIANFFGGISVIADRPIGIGEFGRFGDLFGTVEDIGLRSTRVRTLNRTVVSVPNTTFAGYNLENYALRDKILFNPTIQIKRASPEDRVRGLIESLRESLAAHREVESVPTPVRITGLAGGAMSIEIFCWVLTADIDRFYTIQGDLYLAMNRALDAAAIELA